MLNYLSEKEAAKLKKELFKLAKKIKNKELRRKVEELLKEAPFDVEAVDTAVELKRTSLEEAPAAKSYHHAYKGGLLQHTVATTKLALALCDVIEEVYGGEVDRDVVVAASLLHDLYKVYSYEQKENGEYKFTDCGRLLDHLTMAVRVLFERGFPLEVVHAVLSHHGEASPTSPKTVEALVVHLADLVDTTQNARILGAFQAIMRECQVQEALEGAKVNPYQLVKLKQRKGCQGLKEELLQQRKA